jgi:putative transposase
MKYDPAIHRRRSIRLKGYDYSQSGFYFITVCTQNRLCLFGKIENGEMIVNDAGTMIFRQWQALADRFHFIETHEIVIMPNHIHTITAIHPRRGDPCDRPDNPCDRHDPRDRFDNPKDPQQNVTGEHKVRPYGGLPCPVQPRVRPYGTLAGTVGRVVQVFKSMTTHEYIKGVQRFGWVPFIGKLWQRNYYEHVIRDEASYLKITDYTITNPLKWKEDQYYV